MEITNEVRARVLREEADRQMRGESEYFVERLRRRANELDPPTPDIEPGTHVTATARTYIDAVGFYGPDGNLYAERQYKQVIYYHDELTNIRPVRSEPVDYCGYRYEGCCMHHYRDCKGELRYYENPEKMEGVLCTKCKRPIRLLPHERGTP